MSFRGQKDKERQKVSFVSQSVCAYIATVDQRGASLAGSTWSDAHEWINEIPTVPIYYLANPQPRERAWHNQRGKKTLLSLTLVRLCEVARGM